MLLLLMGCSMLMSIFIMTLKHPMSMGLTLLIQTINMALTMGFFNLNYWFSYILFLIMIGGMLVLFIYMTSIASNEMFKPSIKLLIVSIIIIITFMYLYMNFDSYYFMINNTYKNQDFMLSLNKYLNFPNNLISLMLIIYLLITLLAVVKITNFKKGALRYSN